MTTEICELAIAPEPLKETESQLPEILHTHRPQTDEILKVMSSKVKVTSTFPVKAYQSTVRPLVPSRNAAC